MNISVRKAQEVAQTLCNKSIWNKMEIGALFLIRNREGEVFEDMIRAKLGPHGEYINITLGVTGTYTFTNTSEIIIPVKNLIVEY